MFVRCGTLTFDSAKSFLLSQKPARQLKSHDLVDVALSFSFDATLPVVMGRDSAVGIATRYGLDGPGVESLWG